MPGYTSRSALEQAKGESAITRDGDTWLLTITTGGAPVETRGLHNYEARRQLAAWRRQRVKELLALNPDPFAVAGSIGGKKRAAQLTAKRRQEIAKAAGKRGGRGHRRSRTPKNGDKPP